MTILRNSKSGWILEKSPKTPRTMRWYCIILYQVTIPCQPLKQCGLWLVAHTFTKSPQTAPHWRTSCFESLRSLRNSGGLFFFSRAVLSSCCSTSYSPSVHHCSETLLQLLTCLDSLLQCSFSRRMDDLICSLDILNSFNWSKQMGKNSKLQQNCIRTEIPVCFSLLVHMFDVVFCSFWVTACQLLRFCCWSSLS